MLQNSAPGKGGRHLDHHTKTFCLTILGLSIGLTLIAAGFKAL